MEIVDNSRKESEIREIHKQISREKELILKERMEIDIESLPREALPDAKKHIIIAVVLAALGLLIADIKGMVFGGILGFILYGSFALKILFDNKMLNKQIQDIEHSVYDEIKKVYREEEIEATAEFESYKNNARQFESKLIRNKKMVLPIVDHMALVLKNKLNEADSRAHVQVISGTINYTVTFNGIVFQEDDQKETSKNNFLFHENGYKPLKNDYQCAGMACALIYLTEEKIGKTYDGISRITKSKATIADENVVLQIDLLNKNYRPPIQL